ncbi:hypothetical protein PAPYR_7284 [Paratrimastix pyriformis]|uniref:Uncharacterized protein n=1 Tax=Paratrimastix pyriformis TaxID=342808 RepID=A0ABQ8UGK4_9EUKA|nr:hypothetical protein PAPYR_7284 [Paratrimastix pyriformis]
MHSFPAQLRYMTSVSTVHSFPAPPPDLSTTLAQPPGPPLTGGAGYPNVVSSTRLLNLLRQSSDPAPQLGIPNPPETPSSPQPPQDYPSSPTGLAGARGGGGEEEGEGEGGEEGDAEIVEAGQGQGQGQGPWRRLRPRPQWPCKPPNPPPPQLEVPTPPSPPSPPPDGAPVSPTPSAPPADLPRVAPAPAALRKRRASSGAVMTHHLPAPSCSRPAAAAAGSRAGGDLTSRSLPFAQPTTGRGLGLEEDGSRPATEAASHPAVAAPRALRLPAVSPIPETPAGSRGGRPSTSSAGDGASTGSLAPPPSALRASQPASASPGGGGGPLSAGLTLRAALGWPAAPGSPAGPLSAAGSLRYSRAAQGQGTAASRLRNSTIAGQGDEEPAPKGALAPSAHPPGPLLPSASSSALSVTPVPSPAPSGSTARTPSPPLPALARSPSPTLLLMEQRPRTADLEAANGPLLPHPAGAPADLWGQGEDGLVTTGGLAGALRLGSRPPVLGVALSSKVSQAPPRPPAMAELPHRDHRHTPDWALMAMAELPHRGHRHTPDWALMAMAELPHRGHRHTPDWALMAMAELPHRDHRHTPDWALMAMAELPHRGHRHTPDWALMAMAELPHRGHRHTAIAAQYHLVETSPMPPAPRSSQHTAVPADKLWRSTVFPALQPARRKDVGLLERWLDATLLRLKAAHGLLPRPPSPPAALPRPRRPG